MAWRRRTFVFATAAALLAVAVAGLGAVAALTQTDPGRALLLRAVVPTLDALIPGRLYVGPLHGSLVTGLSIDSLDIRDPSGRPFVQSGPIHVTYDLRDLLDRRIVLKSLEVSHPIVTLVDYGRNDWNWRRAFQRGGPPTAAGRGAFGRYITIDTAIVHEATVLLHQAWTPPDSLRGTRADSAIRFQLRRLDEEFRQEDGRIVRVMRFARVNIHLGRTRLADPDTAGQRFAIRQLDVVWVFPPLWFHELSGDLRIRNDSLWVDGARFRLSNSAAHGSAIAAWGGAQPVRYDIRLQGDTVALADLAWIHESVPRTGGGRLQFTMRNNPADLSIMEYGVRDMDVRTLHSHLLGRMTFGVGGPVLRMTDLGLDLRPAHTTLLQHFNGGPLPYDWQGTLSGRVDAAGGPVTAFQLDRAALTYDDAHVPGAQSRGVASGRLNLLRPSQAVLLGVDLQLDALDLRTPRFVNPSFPRVNGFVRGRLRLDSLWRDARFTNADLYHVDGPGTPSHLTGSGHYTLQERGVWFDVDLQAEPLAYTTLSRSYPDMPLRGTAVGPIRATGVAEDFALQLTLAGEGGELTFAGRAEARDSILGGTGPFTMRGGNLQALFGDSRVPSSALAVSGDVAVRGTSFASLDGRVHALVDQYSRLADARVFGGQFDARFANGVMLVDSAMLESSAMRLSARGGIGLRAGRSDSLRFVMAVDSLGGLRPWLQGREFTEALALPVDTLRGTMEMRGQLSGSVDTLDPAGLALRAQATVSEMAIGATRAARGALTVQVQDLLHGGDGVVDVALDSAELLGVRIASVIGRSTVWHGLAERFGIALRTPSDARVTAAGGVSRQGEETTLRLDTLTIRVDSGAAVPRGFQLQGPAVLRVAAGGTKVLDSLVLVHTDTGRIALRGAMGPAGQVQGRLALDWLPLADVGRLVQAPGLRAGTATAAFTLAGTRERPQIAGTLRLRDAIAGPIRLAALDVQAQYAAQRLELDAALAVRGQTALTATVSLPLDLALVTGRPRRLDAPLRGQLVTERADLSLVESLFPAVTAAGGQLSTRIALTGSWEQPRLRGQLHMDSASLSLAPLGIRLDHLAADVALADDSILVRRFGATSGARTDSVNLQGVIRLTDPQRPAFDLQLVAHAFQAVDKSRTASLVVTTTTPLTLTGTREAPRIRGAVRIDRGRVYIRALAQQRGLDLNDTGDGADSVGQSVNGLLPSAPNALVQNLVLDNVRVNIGDDVWLRSPEANLKLGGSLQVTRALGRDGARARLALSDSLVVERGTYQLNLGIARPSFAVERGVVRFFGDPDLEPALDITALHTVRELRPNSNRQDVRIRVGIGGTLDRPSLTLASADNPPLPESDMLSYLVTGEPAYALLGTTYADQGATLALRLAGSYLSSRLAGGRFDVVQVEPTALAPGEAANLRENGLGILASTRVGVGGQVARNTYFTFSTGLCGLAPQTSGGGDALSLFAQGLGVKVERRFERGVSVAVGLEPGSSAQSCGRLGLSRTFQQTPPQIGIDFFRIWTF